MNALARRRQPEHALQTALTQHLRLRVHPDVLWFHVANQRKADARTGAILKRMGALAGVSDLLLFRPGKCPHCGGARLEGFAIELKAPGGRLTEAQLNFMARFNDAGGHGASAEGVDRAIACLEGWGLLRGRAS
jgi:VRR-NUC domain